AGRGRGGRVSDPVPFARSGAYPPRPGNAVRPLVDGEPAFRRIAAAVESARASVWVTVAFVERDLVLPGARGTLFDLLDRAAARGLDVRALFWREPELGRPLPGASHFAGGAEERAWLAARGTRWLARWDHLPRYRPAGAWPGAARAGRLPFPAALSPPAGATTVQITRTVRGRRYRDPTAAPGAAPFPIEGGERSVLEQYLAAVGAARRTIYLEN